MSKDGFVLLHRSIMDNPWYMKKPFTKNEAWIDIILLTNHSDSFIDKRGVIIDVARGECGWSISALEHRWGWSDTKVKKFLENLEKMEQIKVVKVGKVTTKIKVLNYEKYQSKEQKAEQKQNKSGSKAEQKQNKSGLTNNDKQLNNEKQGNISKEEREIIFFNEMQKYASMCKNPKSLTDFISYWTESKPTGKKLKWEMQKTFDFKKRLKKWLDNDYEKTEEKAQQITIDEHNNYGGVL